MTEQELRALVREAIAKAGAGAPVHGAAKAAPYGATHVGRGFSPAETSGHSSQALFTLPPGDPDGRCIIEPGVACNHCGYCKSYGH
ncbi:MAG TPA: hypothetical protein VFO31_00880 [Vicinamibacterales bacterium]|nr:hypothetical protein [Vicinamibacterales bacterium]